MERLDHYGNYTKTITLLSFLIEGTGCKMQSMNPLTLEFTRYELEWLRKQSNALHFQVHFRCDSCEVIQPICILISGYWLCGRPRCWGKWVISTETISR